MNAGFKKWMITIGTIAGVLILICFGIIGFLFSEIVEIKGELRELQRGSEDQQIPNDKEHVENGEQQANQLDTLRSKVSVLSASVDDNKLRIGQQENQLEAVQSEVSVLSTSVDGSRTNVDQIHNQLLSITSTLEDLEESINEEQGELVAFTAHATRDQTVQRGEKVYFSRADKNFGNHYNPSSSTFTCPISGVYLFQLAIVTQPGKVAQLELNWGTASVLTDGTVRENDDLIGHYSHASNLGIIQCGAGGSVFVRGLAASSDVQGTFSAASSFSGLLLHKI